LAKTIAAHTVHISEEVLALSMSEDAGVPEIESELGVNVALSRA
jgi:isoleucyl-tRNA synthetase